VTDSKLLISVAVPAPLFGTFHYLLPDDQTATPPPGTRVLVPFGARTVVGIVLERQEDVLPVGYNFKPLLKIFAPETGLDGAVLQLLEWAARYYCHPIGECCHLALPALLRKGHPAPALELLRWRRTELPYLGSRRAHKQLAALTLLEAHPEGLWQQSLSEAGFAPALLRTLESKGYIKAERSASWLDHDLAQTARKSTRHTLSSAQQHALDTLLDYPPGFAATLLQGITGSGKTEIYIEYVLSVLEQGMQALILIPEINLTPQTFNRFQRALPFPIVTLHSGMSNQSKYETWQLARNGSAKVVIGTRSAIFCSFQQLGCIIVDEEHDSSFKQNDSFRYSGRDLAIKRAQIEQCPILLGSATPSLETWHNARLGRYHWITLSQRAGSAQLPAIHLIDIRSRPLVDGCSPPLLERIGQTLNEGNQVIVFQNRRGFAPTLMCHDCGWVALCQHCDARMTLHANPAHLRCHHCDARQRIPPQCPQCGGRTLNPIGTGTERIEIGLREHFPGTVIHRIDRDRFKRAEDMQGLIDTVGEGKPCILIGTQMLAKGHDFQHVTLVCVVDADSSFFSADFRALEKGAQQLIQIAGRTGRGDKRGMVLIQTRQPDHPLFESIKSHNYSNAIQMLIAERQSCQLPPFSKLLSLRAESSDPQAAETCLLEIKPMLQGDTTVDGLIVCGPLPAQIMRKQDRYRFYLHTYITQPAQRLRLSQLLPEILASQKQRKVRLSIDVDPLDYL
jgi:primosomal protein N' (replication factor Y)